MRSRMGEELFNSSSEEVELTPREKAALAIVAMGSERAAKVYEYFNVEEVEALTMEISLLGKISISDFEGTMTEFAGMCIAHKSLNEGGIDYAKTVIEKALGENVANTIIDKLQKNVLKSREFSFIRKVAPENVFAFIQHEHPQTIALILSYTTPEQGSAILSALPKEIQVDIAGRIATMDKTSPGVVNAVETTLSKQLSSMATVDLAEVGGVNHIAEILNSVDRGTERHILEEIHKVKPSLSDEIRQKMFVFEDIVLLEASAIQRFLQEVNITDLLVALKGANEAVTSVIDANMSIRMRETMAEEAQYIKNIRLSEVEEAQQKLVSIVRRLEEAGEIVVLRGKGDEIIE